MSRKTNLIVIFVSGGLWIVQTVMLAFSDGVMFFFFYVICILVLAFYGVIPWFQAKWGPDVGHRIKNDLPTTYEERGDYRYYEFCKSLGMYIDENK